MIYLLDTDVLSYYLKGRTEVLFQVNRIDKTQISVSSISTMEIEYGFMLNPISRQNYEQTLRNFLDEVHLLEFNALDGLMSAKIRSELYRQGQSTGRYDVLLAGTAIARDLVLVTNNTKHFSGIHGLKLENWTQS
jgi:tRNA(fMet)-specific endonuclease VapC